MATLFTRIIEGDLPGRFVWRDDTAVAFLTIEPLTPGHTLVVPRVEVDHWLDLDEEVWVHCSMVARTIGLAIQAAFDPPRVATIVAGFEVPHTHLHVLQTSDMADLDFARVDRRSRSRRPRRGRRRAAGRAPRPRPRPRQLTRPAEPAW